ncbi:MAG TPA: metallophosphoesterase [Flavobacteriaceae bacterium]|nr:metallophosphoesterase [Flavobacteriaceae bacterium]
MKKILLLSDTHSHIDNQMLKHIKEADEVWHAGDIGDINVTDTIQKHSVLRAVYGNIDNTVVRNSFPEDAKFTIEKVKVWMTHIGGYPNRYDFRIREALKKNPPNLFISGHSHILKVIFDKKLNLLHINPGAVGKYGIHTVRTMVRFEIENEVIKNLAVIELEQRNKKSEPNKEIK